MPGILTAVGTALRYGVLVALFLVRFESPGTTAAAVAVSLGLLYVFGRRDPAFRLWAGYVLAVLLFANLRSLADETGIPVRFEYVVDLERVLFAGHSPSVWLQEHLYVPGEVGAVEIASIAVYFSYFFVPHLVALWLWLRRRDLFGRYATALLGSAYLGLAISFAVPTAPPWLAGQSGHLPLVSRIVEDVVTGVNPSAYSRGYEMVGINPVAAMPSLHMAGTVIVLLAAWRAGFGLRLAGIAYAAAMAFALVYTGEHYVVDVAAGSAVAAFAWTVAGAAQRSPLRAPRVRSPLRAPLRALARRA
jgi:membrane-associated phospholipid phosphatase